MHYKTNLFDEESFLRTVPENPGLKSELEKQKLDYMNSRDSGHLELVESDDFSWKQSAKCLGLEPDTFFPERGGSLKAAKSICDDCSVEDKCREYAIESESIGVWGGTSERERRKIRRARELAARAIENS